MVRRRFLQILAGFGAVLSGWLRPSSVEAQVSDPIVTAVPDVLVLPPGASAPVTITVDPASPYGVGSVTIPVTVPQPYDYLIEGGFQGTIGPGQTGFILGDVSLTGDLIVEGALTGVDTFTLEGNGHQILAQNGGTIVLSGKPKPAWVGWGGAVVGWESGDRIAVAATKAGVYLPSEAIWQGSWEATNRPLNSPDVSLIGGVVARPEVVNLSQTIVLKNLRRIHFHDAAGVQSLKYLRVLDSGTVTLGDYPIHFHLNGEASRGSIVEEVVVEGGKHRAFVPHGSHGIVMRGCVAYKSQSGPFWWDPPLSKTHTANNSNDTNWERCFALGGSNLGKQGFAFALGAGSGNRCVDCVVAGFEGFDDVPGRDEVNGFYWPSDANQNVGGNVWVFERNVAHNNSNGIRVWQNDSNAHNPKDSVFFRNKRSGALHGAYTNKYRFDRILSQQNGESAFHMKALGDIKVVDLVSDGRLEIRRHFAPSTGWVEYIRCTFTSVFYDEEQDNPSKIRYIDCGLVPADFIMEEVRPLTEIEIVEAGVVTHRWAAGVWS